MIDTASRSEAALRKWAHVAGYAPAYVGARSLALLRGLAGKDYSRRLAIVVPYRDREQHLRAFLPHMERFLRAEGGPAFRHAIHVVEQVGSGPFNRGKLKNVGFTLCRDRADYVCFHDVDYLPLRADYSYCDRPTRLIWKGLTLWEDYFRFFGGVTAFPVEEFERVNGYSNDYRGWGYEDTDLFTRCRRAGLSITRRDGRFRSLPHAHVGWEGRRPTPATLANRERFERKLADFRRETARDGLSSLEFHRVETTAGCAGGRRVRHALHHRVEI